MKKKLLKLALLSFLFYTAVHINKVNASSTVETCLLGGTISQVADNYIYVQIDKKENINNGSNCDSLVVNSQYFFENDNFLRNTYSKSIFVGQTLVIAGFSYLGMGPNSTVSGEGWMLKSAGKTIVNLPINLTKAVQEESKDNLIEGQTYAPKELRANTSSVARKFFMEAYLITTIISAEGGSPFITVSENQQAIKAIETIRINVNSWNDSRIDNLKEGEKYLFEVSVINVGKNDKLNNVFSLIAVKDIKSKIKPNQFYSIGEINANLFEKGDKISTNGYIIGIYRCPACPKDGLCAPCEQDPNITISEDLWKGGRGDESHSNKEIKIFIKEADYGKLEIEKKYSFALRYDGNITSGRQDFTLLKVEKISGEKYDKVGNQPAIKKKPLIIRWWGWLMGLFKK